MLRAKNRSRVIFIVLVALFTYSERVSPLCLREDQPQLKQILSRAAEYCEKVKNIALFYVCMEKIKDAIYFYRTTSFQRVLPGGGVIDDPRNKSLELKRTRIYSYTYDYQLIKKEDQLIEKRILLEKNGKKMRKENAELEVRFSGKYLIYGPVGFLSRYWQDYFDYEIIGQEQIEQTRATVIKATPRPNNEENRNSARIWIGKNDGSTLQIEWEPESKPDYEQKKIRSPAGDLETIVVWRVAFGMEINGVRFPSQQKVQEFLITKEGKRFIRNETTTVFDKYRFFVVETEIKQHP
jgi:hypothetical protein